MALQKHKKDVIFVPLQLPLKLSEVICIQFILVTGKYYIIIIYYIFLNYSTIFIF